METCFVDNMSYDRVPRFSRPQNGKDDLKQTVRIESDLDLDFSYSLLAKVAIM